MTILTQEEEQRYSRQILLRQIDFEGQESLKSSRILIIGLGGLGCAAAQYLAVAGVGKMTLVDDDKVEISNLQRQVLHSDGTIGQWKVDSAKHSLQKLNPHVQIQTIHERLSDNALLPLVEAHDVVLDCSDNLETRNQLNALCFKVKKTLISGAAIRIEGQLITFTYTEDEPCYQCFSALFGEHTLTCTEAGVLSPIVGVIGAMQALEALKVITKISPVSSKYISIFDGIQGEWRRFNIQKKSDCPVCGIFLESDSMKE